MQTPVSSPDHFLTNNRALASSTGVGWCPRCEASHSGFSNCFHYRVTKSLIEAHTRLDTNFPSLDQASLALEKSPNPPVDSLLNLDHGADAIALIMNESTSGMPEIADRMAAFIIMYRLLKWRLYPHPSHLVHVPDFYRPTSTQLAVPHPVTIDFLAFPALRDALLEDPSLYLNAGAAWTARFDMAFTANLTVQWPPLEPLIIRTPGHVRSGGGPSFALNPAFEAHCLDFENWAMRPAWCEAYPELAHCVNKCRPSFSFQRKGG